jgi:hypothetical protein
MPKADVTYNTIGFVGTCASGGSTFTLYLDDEKTGAKTYHIYFKQLGGGKLTLTTGKAGATNLTLNSGTYVAIIYVDEDGNVTTQGTTVTNSVTVDNLQSVSSNAVASLLNTDKNDTSEVSITSQVTKSLGVTDVVAFRKNNIVYMYISGTYTGGQTTSTQRLLSGIPVKYRPAVGQSVVLTGYNSSQYVSFGRAVIYSDGNMDLGETNWVRGTALRAGFIFMA